ncbi:MAG: hypothetical protein KDD50_07005 [Bdellovibrionales bacterium]|nr:hypothetical protein [Bdellovibrionales bacterium]
MSKILIAFMIITSSSLSWAGNSNPALAFSIDLICDHSRTMCGSDPTGPHPTPVELPDTESQADLDWNHSFETKHLSDLVIEKSVRVIKNESQCDYILNIKISDESGNILDDQEKLITCTELKEQSRSLALSSKELNGNNKWVQATIQLMPPQAEYSKR